MQTYTHTALKMKKNCKEELNWIFKKRFKIPTLKEGHG